MARLLIVLLLFPLAASAVEWRYNGEMPDTGVASGDASAPAAADMGGSLPGTPANAPTNDMSMSKVRQTFGDPQKTWDAVGKPPITRWQYPQYIVYFENDRVITSVSGRL
jgi:hypothetical protein